MTTTTSVHRRRAEFQAIVLADNGPLPESSDAQSLYPLCSLQPSPLKLQTATSLGDLIAPPSTGSSSPLPVQTRSVTIPVADHGLSASPSAASTTTATTGHVGSAPHGSFMSLAATSGTTSRSSPPKALLPVANRPMLAHVLEWLENAGVNEIFLVTNPAGAPHVRSFLAKHYDSIAAAPTIPTTEVVVIPEDAGSADALRAVSSRITTDFIFLTCDLYTECNPRLLLDCHRLHQPTVTCLLFDGAKSEQGGASIERGANKENELAEYIGVDHASSRVMFLANGRDMDPEEGVKLRISALRKSPDLQISTHLRSSHLYIFRPWVLDLLAANRDLETVEADLIPLLVKFQYRSERYLKKWDVSKHIKAPPGPLVESRLLSATNLNFSLDTESAPYHATEADYRDFIGGAAAMVEWSGASRHLNSREADVLSAWPHDMIGRSSAAASLSLAHMEPSLSVLISSPTQVLPSSPNGVSTTSHQRKRTSEASGGAAAGVSSLNSASSEHNRRHRSRSGVRGSAFVNVMAVVAENLATPAPPPSPGTQPPPPPYTLRASEPWSYLELNRYLTRPTVALPVRVASSADVHARSTVGQDSLVGDGTRIGERCSIKKSVIGAHCVIGKGVKLSGSVVMDYTVIEDNVKLDNCIVGFHAKIGKGSTLLNCDVLPHVVVKDGSQVKGERVEYEE
ncbi:nucleotide-diphospho-sugar transferase [Gonapodya prolifera JEL478]|uniref:Translation initiation factor eIF2B subunit gamma n=1 Tax=Gonapodya prolifera (strain JEL478) TaxID=1344416 RepID=A0A139AND1_GONPJ|nr:nucleotide-diphospho-sugar transferase [Gonapodya prolifera JEL478]|eukprot:KXS18015.1 nucleotide-diphospho-sugar transferase [Gonapodya prolifera JEL478]